MAETMKGSQFTRKVGPLPVWAWAALIIVAYIAYRHFKGSAPATAPAATGSSGNPVPGFDAASGGINGAYTPGTGSVYNYYYGDQNAAQAGGGGTGGSSTWTPPPGSPYTTPPGSTTGGGGTGGTGGSGTGGSGTGSSTTGFGAGTNK